MVKNLKGGKGAKSLARKNSVVSHTSTHIPLPTHPLEMIAVVSKFYGNSFDAYVTNRSDLIRCMIRGKFSGRNKRSNFVSIGSFVMIAFREFEAPTYKNADLIFVYDHNDIPLLSSLTDIRLLINYANTNCRTASDGADGDIDDNDLFSFSNTNIPSYRADIDNITSTDDNINTTNKSASEIIQDFNIDDI
jgi:hypothetical protein